MSEDRVDEDGSEDIPDKELVDARFAGVALFPGNLRMKDISKNGRKSGRNKNSKPEEIFVVEDKVCKDGVNYVVEEGENDTDNKISTGMLRGFGRLWFFGFIIVF